MKKNEAINPILQSPFKLTPEDIKEIQQMCLQTFGISIDNQKATEAAIELLLAVKATFKPIPKNYAK